MDDLSSRLTKINEVVAVAAKKAGRQPSEVELLAVSKTQPIEAINEAFRAGITHFGENKVQEARGKIETLGRGVWHLIGHLQSNKAREAVRLFDFIDSVDRLDLAEEINQRADAAGKTQNVLLQVNIAGESTKFGCLPEAARPLAEVINSQPRLALGGLMTIAPYSPDPEKSRPHFAGLRELRDAIQADTGLHLPVLSMGMSGDFAVAIEEGSTCVRIGTALFGERVKFKNRRPEGPSFTEST
jgi:pyridoxal phosphate enzyme (YggS family)